jgi:undecaprenyl-diphosphatase
MTSLLHFDQLAFEWINHDWHTYWLDAVMPVWRDKTTWFPLYALAAGWLGWRYRRNGLIFLVAVALTIVVADQTSSELIKKSVRRIRPCNDPSFRDQVELLVPCGNGYSFTSSHATNHFALAMFITMTLGRRFRRIRWPLFLWAATIALGQVYVGVHYPLDITAGALTGVLLGYLFSLAYRKWLPLPYQIPMAFAKAEVA